MENNTMVFNVGLVGTGYAAKLRAEAIVADARSRLVAVSGQDRDRTTAFCQPYGATVVETWGELVQRSDIDLVVIATINSAHGAIVRVALQAGKHVVVEYPLSLDVAEAEDLIHLAHIQRRLLHVEHIELLSGIHQALVTHLPAIGQPFHIRSINLKPDHPAPRKWSYHVEQFGFPLVGALSRIHRLTAVFGCVDWVSGQLQIQPAPGGSFFTSCMSTAQLRFVNSITAEVNYGKGEAIWQAERVLEVQGDRGMIRIVGAEGTITDGSGTRSITVGSRRGLFAQDTRQVLDHLVEQRPLYVTPESSLYALKVADAIRRSATTHQAIAGV